MKFSIVCALVVFYTMAATDLPAKPKGKKKPPAQQTQPADETIKIEVTGSAFDNKNKPPGDKGKPSPYEYAVADYGWDRGEPAVKLTANDASFCFLTSIAGSLAGYGEKVSLAPGVDGNWYLACTTQQPLAARAAAVTTKLRREFEDKYELHSWQRGQSAVKMIHKDEGFCFLSSVSGTFRGFGEQVRVYINPDDGFWYLDGHSGQAQLAAKAYSVKLVRGSAIKLECTEHVWSRGKADVPMLPQDQGFCFLSSVAGNFAGFGENVYVKVNDQGDWVLGGTSQQPLSARAYSVKVTR
jgi:hypothetical protein